MNSEKNDAVVLVSKTSRAVVHVWEWPELSWEGNRADVQQGNVTCSGTRIHFPSVLGLCFLC